MQPQLIAPAVEREDEQSSEPPSRMRADEPPSLSVPESSLKSPAGSQWSDWRWQIRNRIRTLEQLSAYLPGLSEREDLKAVIAKYPMAITPYYASLIRKPDLSDPIFRMSVPNPQELSDPPCLSEDPLEEHIDMPVPGLIHRYKDRALLIAT
ncbi:MAG TPA: hypothetical protein PLV55_07895, partial [Anaerohalosphaeraceae bacterium]|nr:hypothetical protein [Anaerohalosphaeraceae bacterium]